MFDNVYAPKAERNSINSIVYHGFTVVTLTARGRNVGICMELYYIINADMN